VRARLLVTLLSTAALSFATPARADDTRALAETLFREGKELMARKAYDDACPKLAESQRLDPADGTLIALAICHEAQHRTATAWAEFVEAETSSRKSGRADRVKFARARIDALEPLLARLTVQVAASGKGVEVMRDGLPMSEATWGSSVPVDPGLHVIEATAPGKKPWREQVNIEHDGDRKTVVVPTLEDEAKELLPQAAGHTAPAPPEKRSRVPIYAAAGAGVVAVAAGTFFGLEAFARQGDVDRLCPSGVCTNARGFEANDDAKRAADASTIAFALGAVALGLAAYLFLRAD
jgi:hypothetical protein